MLVAGDKGAGLAPLCLLLTELKKKTPHKHNYVIVKTSKDATDTYTQSTTGLLCNDKFYS